VTISLDSARLAGTAVGTALDAAVFAASASDVRGVIVGGREVVRDGRHLEIDVPRELAASIEGIWA
jgi:cytosine/adenosine deaminase-related metal-dependent hydrolase